jgi:hypothetical protein
MGFCQLHTWRNIPNSPKRYALISRHPATRTAVVFVHGFLGDSVGTWEQFQVKIDQISTSLKWWSTCDLFFFGYPSADQRIGLSASQLLGFLRQIIPEPNPLLFFPGETARTFTPDLDISSFALRASSPYTALVLVGHSQGAVVIRQAILDSVDSARTRLRQACGPDLDDPSAFDFLDAWFALLLNARLCLFSPAHRGLSLSGLAGVLYESSLLRSIFQPALAGLSPAFRELQDSSQTLADLRTRTESHFDAFRLPALSATIVYGAEDHVVSDLRFSCDPPPIYQPGQTHASVCKPTAAYTAPLEHVSDVETRHVTASQH